MIFLSRAVFYFYHKMQYFRHHSGEVCNRETGNKITGYETPWPRPKWAQAPCKGPICEFFSSLDQKESRISSIDDCIM